MRIAFRQAHHLPQDYAALHPVALGHGPHQRYLRMPRWLWPFAPCHSTRRGMGSSRANDRGVPSKRLYGHQPRRNGHFGNPGCHSLGAFTPSACLCAVGALVLKALFAQDTSSSINLGTNHPVLHKLTNPLTLKDSCSIRHNRAGMFREAWESLTWWVCGTWC